MTHGAVGATWKMTLLNSNETLRLMSWRTIGLCRNILHLGEGLNADVMEVSSKHKVFHYHMSYSKAIFIVLNGYMHNLTIIYTRCIHRFQYKYVKCTI